MLPQASNCLHTPDWVGIGLRRPWTSLSVGMSAVRARGSACTSVPTFWDSLGGTFLHLCDLVLSLIPQLYPISSMTLNCLRRWGRWFGGLGFNCGMRESAGTSSTTPSLLCHLSSTSTLVLQHLHPSTSPKQVYKDGLNNFFNIYIYLQHLHLSSTSTSIFNIYIYLQHRHLSSNIDIYLQHRHLSSTSTSKITSKIWTILQHHQFQPNITKNNITSSFKLIQFRHLSNVNSALLKPGSLHHQNTYKLHKNTGLYITNFNQISPKTLHLQTASN